MDVPQGQGFHATADYARDFIWHNSVHKIDEEFYAHWGNTPVIVSKMISYAQGQHNHPPHLECSSRSGLMSGIMESLGYRVRSVDVYKHLDEFPAHSFLEVLNPETDKWEIYDADYNIFWCRTADGHRAGIKDIISAPDLDAVLPCLAGDICGWSEVFKTGAESLRGYYGLAVIIDRDADERPLLINRSRFPFEKAAPVSGRANLAYCEYRAKNCKEKITFYQKITLHALTIHMRGVLYNQRDQLLIGYFLLHVSEIFEAHESVFERVLAKFIA